MILFSNSYFKLDYEASGDILFVTLPDMSTAGLSEAEQCFEIMVEHVKNYHVHNLLLDSSKAVVEVDDAAYHRLIYQVSMLLKKTRLQKVARIVSNMTRLEKMAVQVQGEVLKSQPETYQIQNFTSKELALEWLTDKPSRPCITAFQI